jgi:hypothetical protein
VAEALVWRSPWSVIALTFAAAISLANSRCPWKSGYAAAFEQVRVTRRTFSASWKPTLQALIR